jgi:preprotein translocase SecY subunit
MQHTNLFSWNVHNHKFCQLPRITDTYGKKILRAKKTKASKLNLKVVSKTKESDIVRRSMTLLGLVTISRIGSYIPVSSQIDTVAFSEALGSSGGLTGYEDIFLGSSLSKVGVFSLGIIPNINASIIMQFLSYAFPNLKKLQKDEGPAGRRNFSLYQKLVTLVLALVQAVGELTFIKPFVSEFNLYWLFENSVVLATGTIIISFLSNEIDKLRFGSGSSILIFANIISTKSYLLSTVLNQGSGSNPGEVSIYLVVLFLTILGIAYVQEAERKIPINYASRNSETAARSIGNTYYLPFKVNATGVMPIILSSSLLSLPATISRFGKNEVLEKLALSFSPTSSLYTPYNVVFIFLLNYFYTFIQFDTNDVAENLKKSGASIPRMRPGKSTAQFLEG